MEHLIKDTKKRTAQRHELHDSPWVWYVVIGILGFWVGWMAWEGLKALVI